MKIHVHDCKEMTTSAINAVNEAIKLSKGQNFSPEQVNALNTGNIALILGAIANSLAVIADNLEKGDAD